MEQSRRDPGETVDLFKRSIDTATLAVIIAGLFFAWDQAGKLKESIDANNTATYINTWSDIASQTIQIDQEFIQNPDLQPYFYDGKELQRSDPAYQRVYAVAVAELDYFDSVATFINNKEVKFPDYLLARESWNRYFRRIFRRSPVMCAVYKETSNEYGPSLRQVAQSSCTIK